MNGNAQRPNTQTRPMINLRPGGGRGAMQGRMNAEKPKNTGASLRRLLRYIGKSRVVLIALLVIMLVITGIDLLGPLFQGRAIDAIEPVYKDAETGEVLYNFGGNKRDANVKTTFVVHMQSEDYIGRDGHTRGLYFYLIALAAIFAVSGVLNYVMGILAAKLSQRTVWSLRSDLFKKISRLPISYTDTHRHGDIMSRMANDAENISNAVSQSITSLFSALLTLVGAFVMMLILSPLMTLVAVVTIPLSVLVSTGLAKFMRKYFVRQQKLLGQMNGTVEEMVTSYQTVMAFGKEKKAVDTFSEVSGQFRDCAVKARVWGSIMGPIMNFLGNMQYVLIAATGGALILFGGPGVTVSIGNIQSMLSYSKKFTHPINQIANQYASILTALAGAERIFEMLDSPDETDEGQDPITAADVCGDIGFEDLHFGYVPTEPVLKGFDLSVRRGEKIAIVGATGSGKTTVVNLLTRFYEPDGGRITVDGVNVADIKKRELRRAIAIVLQDTVLFRDTIRANIKYGAADATDEEMVRAATLARAADFIDRLPEGYDTVLSEGGSNLSQGQRQLLSIARAILADPKILILDEATSSVDTRTEMHIQQAMVALMKNRTSLIIAHRLSTIRDADRIVVLKDGVIAETGDHDTLLKQNGAYAELYRNQFAGIAT